MSPERRKANATTIRIAARPGIEPEELHAGLARDEQQREDDTDREVREEEEEDH